MVIFLLGLVLIDPRTRLVFFVPYAFEWSNIDSVTMICLQPQFHAHLQLRNIYLYYKLFNRILKINNKRFNSFDVDHNVNLKLELLFDVVFNFNFFVKATNNTNGKSSAFLLEQILMLGQLRMHLWKGSNLFFGEDFADNFVV